MKYLLCFITVSLLCFNTQAANWVCQDEIGNDNVGTKTYMQKQPCDSACETTCHDITGKSKSYFTVQDVQVDDYEKPNYQKANLVSDHEDLDACYAAIAVQPRPAEPEQCLLVQSQGYDDSGRTVCVIQALRYCFEYPGVRAVCNEKIGDDYEAYCPLLTGYDQKTVKRLREDATLKTAYLAAKALVVQRDASRKTKRTARLLRLKACLNSLGGATNAQLKMCVKDILKESIRRELKESDL